MPDDPEATGEDDGPVPNSGRDSPETAPPDISADASSELVPEGGATSGADDDVVAGVERSDSADEPASSRARR